MKYYSIRRPIGPGTFPAGYRVREMKNFDSREFCEEIGYDAWGYIDLDGMIPEEEAERYELIPVTQKVWYCVTSTVYDTGKVKAEITDEKLAAIKPEESGRSLPTKDIYIDWFESVKAATEFMNLYETA